MKLIYKYPLNFNTTNFTTIRIPPPFQISGVGFDGEGNRCVWIAHPDPAHPDIKLQTEQFQIVGTGNVFESCWKPIGIIFQLPFVWHVLHFQRS